MTDEQKHTGTGASRSGDRATESGVRVDPYADVDPAVQTGATSTSHPAQADDVDINRSGSGGSGGPATEDDYGSNPEGGAES